MIIHLYLLLKKILLYVDDDLVTLKGKKDLFTTSSHVISDDLHVYEEVYKLFKSYIDNADQYISKKIFNLL